MNKKALIRKNEEISSELSRAALETAALKKKVDELAVLLGARDFEIKELKETIENLKSNQKKYDDDKNACENACFSGPDSQNAIVPQNGEHPADDIKTNHAAADGEFSARSGGDAKNWEELLQSEALESDGDSESQFDNNGAEVGRSSGSEDEEDLDLSQEQENKSGTSDGDMFEKAENASQNSNSDDGKNATENNYAVEISDENLNTVSSAGDRQKNEPNIDNKSPAAAAFAEAVPDADALQGVMRLAADAIGRVCLKSAALSNLISDSHDPNASDLLTLTLGRTELFKAKAYETANSGFDEQAVKASLNLLEAECLEYFEKIRSQLI